MFWASLAILLLGIVESKGIVHLLRIPFQYLAPAILLLATVGAYAVRSLPIDVAVMFGAGALAYFLRRTGYSVAGIVLGIILGKIGEQTFAQAMQMLHYDVTAYLGRPIGLALLIGGAATLLASLYRSLTHVPPARTGASAVALRRSDTPASSSISNMVRVAISWS